MKKTTNKPTKKIIEKITEKRPEKITEKGTEKGTEKPIKQSKSKNAESNDKTKKISKTPKETATNDDDFWTDDLVDDMIDEDIEDEDESKLVFTKIKDLLLGMENINVEAIVDFIGPVHGKDYGEDPYAMGFLKDPTGEIKITFWGDDIKKAKPGKKVRIIRASISEYKGQLQLNPDKKKGIDFL